MAIKDRVERQVEDSDRKSTINVSEVFRPEFFIKSEIGGTIPARFIPDSFSSNSRRLVTNWISMLLELASLTNLSTPFSIGFIFNSDSIAEYEVENGERVVYINPAILKESAGQARQLLTRWKFDAPGNWELLATAIHEFVHLQGFGDHNEEYAERFTQLTSLVFANRTRFSRHFSAPDCWPE